MLSSRSGAGASERRCPVAVTIYRHLISGARRRLGDTGHRAVVVPTGFARRSTVRSRTGAAPRGLLAERLRVRELVYRSVAYLTRAVDVQDSAARWTGLVARPLEEGNQSAAVGTGSLETVDFHGHHPMRAPEARGYDDPETSARAVGRPGGLGRARLS